MPLLKVLQKQPAKPEPAVPYMFEAVAAVAVIFVLLQPPKAFGLAVPWKPELLVVQEQVQCQGIAPVHQHEHLEYNLIMIHKYQPV